MRAKNTQKENAHTKRIRKDFEMRNLGDYHDLYIQSNTLL